MTTSLLWLRRDLRLADHPALLAARDHATQVLPVFVLDPVLQQASGAPRLAFLYRCLRDLAERTDGALRIVEGPAEQAIPRLAQQVDATGVHISSDHGPYGRQRDKRVREALGDVALCATGSPYGVTPGTLNKGDGEPYRVYTPYARAWRARGIHSPALTPRALPWTDGGVRSVAVPKDPDLGDTELPEAGEAAGRARWKEFLDGDVEQYAARRNLPGVRGTSELSVYLKYGCLHPRTLHAELGGGKGAQTFGGELIWRDFYADVLWHRPESAREELQEPMKNLAYDQGALAEKRWDAWVEGTTGYPIVDAGMRQLRGQAWMHNRLRMIVASFLTKDLHLSWQRGARYFMQALRDGDLASNNHGWQWTAGTGTDPSPYFRVFNPVKQGRDYDPDGDYIRRWVPELRELSAKQIHEPWLLPDGPPNGYPVPIVEHKAEREEALRRYAEARE